MIGTGAWKLENMQPCNLPERLATESVKLFKEEEHKHHESYMPVLYCAEQLVNGTNHMLICKQRSTKPNHVEHLTKVIIHEPLSSNPTDKWKISSIKELV